MTKPYKELEDRYKKRLSEAIRKKLPTIIANEEILENPDKKIKIRVPILDEPYFKPKINQRGGEGGNGGSGNLPGTEPSDYEVEVEFDIEEIAELIFQQLNLPNLKPKNLGEEIEEIRVSGISKTGPYSRLHRKKTFIEVIKQRRLSKEVYRFRDLRIVSQPIIKADIYLARDFSASMDENKRFKVRSLAFWILQFLRLNYPFVKIKFILHDTEAIFVDEETFFKAKHGGGTLVSSAFRLIRKDIETENNNDTNFYIFYFSDGENIESDNENVFKEIMKIYNVVNMIGYVEVEEGSPWFYSFALSKFLSKKKQEHSLSNLRISVMSTVRKSLYDLFGEVLEK
ncbi:MAG: DUF444 family protein [Candidatus Aenigmatarchaeota archaeon]